MTFDAKKDGKRLLFVIISAFGLAVNVNTFVSAGDLFPGGAMGLTILIQRLAERFLHLELSYSVINLLMNAIPVYIGFRFIGKKFTLFSCLCIVLTGLFTDLLPKTSMTDDILLISVFGGIISGAMIALCLSANTTTGGTDFIGIYLSEKKGMDSFPVVLGLNSAILIIAGYFFGWERALYSIIYQFVSTTVIHYLYRRYQQGTLFIVTEKPDEIAAEIYRITGHGATVVDVEGAHEHARHKMLYSVVSRAESNTVIARAREMDPAAFINLIDTVRVSGRFYFRPED
ncbi:MAG: YitT family protein [Lachnospiraceae bacterium]|nr:YitT family protein [Lachnospiraceae bacterium]